MALRGSATCAAIQAGGPSLTRTTNMVLLDVPSATVNLAACSLAWGTAASAPATFGDLANSHSLSLDNCAATYNPVGSKFDRIAVGGVTITGSAGLHLWLCYISSIGTPISGTAIDSAVDCGPIIA